MFIVPRQMKFIVILLVLVLAIAACELPETGLPLPPTDGGEGPEQPQPTEAPPEPEPTEAPPEPEPTQPPPEPEPTQPPPEPEATQAPPPDSGGGETDQADITKILLVGLIVIVIIGFGIIVAVIIGGRGKSESPPAAEQPPAPMTVQDHLNVASPKAAELYQRFADLVQTFGAVEIVATQTRIDYRVRMIFASVQFREDSLLVQLVQPQRLESPRVIRVDTYTQSSFANYLYIRSFEDFDAEFNAWLQEAYNLGVRGI
jgi:flagellar basal body-associated protein FliL